MYYLLFSIIIGALIWYFGIEKSWLLLCFSYKYIKSKLLTDNSSLILSNNRNYFTISGNFGDNKLNTIYVQSLRGMFKYTINAIKIAPDEVGSINLFKIADCYLGTDVSCNILGVARIIVWVRDRTGFLLGTEEITEDKTIRESVINLLQNQNKKVETLAQNISDDKVETGAIEQD